MSTKPALAAALVTTLVAGGCGGGGGDATTVDQQNLQTAIAVSIARQKHRMAVVQCPKSVKAKKGVTFTCTATMASGSQIPFTVTATDDKGNVHYGGFSQSVSDRGASTDRSSKKN